MRSDLPVCGCSEAHIADLYGQAIPISSVGHQNNSNNLERTCLKSQGATDRVRLQDALHDVKILEWCGGRFQGLSLELGNLSETGFLQKLKKRKYFAHSLDLETGLSLIRYLPWWDCGEGTGLTPRHSQ